MSNEIKIYPGSDPDTWPSVGSMWMVMERKYGFGRKHWPEESTIMMLTKVVYATKNEITVQFLSPRKVHTLTVQGQDWNKYFGLVTQTEKSEV